MRNCINIPRAAFCLVVLLLGWLAVQTVHASAWFTNGVLTTPRALATATLLQNGKVLVAGGIDGVIVKGNAELYDPTTGVWTPTGSLNTPRYGHTATLLRNGKVLVASGYDTDYLTSAELYDPTTGTWTVTGSLNTPRYAFSATLMPDGKVLVAGGSSFFTNTPSAEWYNPATETWTTTGNLNEGRQEHTATLLPDGRVLVAGGSGNGSYETVSNMECYDASLGKWTSAGPMIQPRYGHSATLLPNGEVLFAGGSTNGQAPTPFLSAELYDPVAGTNSFTGSMNTGHFFHTATLLPNGTVLVSGGAADSAINATSSTEVYDPSTGIWSPANSLNTARLLHTATLLPSGRILVAGGSADNNEFGIASTETYDPTVAPSTGTWTFTGSMQNARESFSMTLLPNGKVLVAGGENGHGTYTTSAELYDPTTAAWTNTGSLNIARYMHTATLLPNGKVLVTGGIGSTFYISTSELYDPTAGTWATNGAMNIGRYGHTATLLSNGKVLVAGGTTGTNSTELYDPNSNAWTLTGKMINQRSFHTAILLPNGKVLVVGGTQSTESVTMAELYDPVTGLWSPAGQTRAAQYLFTVAVLLPNGNVLVAGKDVNDSPVADLFNPTTGNWSATMQPSHSYFLPILRVMPNGKAVLAAYEGCEIYDPEIGLWTASANLNQPRDHHSATVLTDGRVLIAGGYSTNGLTSAEIYDAGLGFNDSWRPQISLATSPFNLGGSLALNGLGFTGISEAAGGNFQSSPANYPLLQLRSIESGQSTFLLATNWSTNSFASQPVWNFPPGFALATVFVNGIQSTSSIVNLAVPTPTQTALSNAHLSPQGAFQFTFTNTPGAVLGVLTSTNLLLATTNWTALGGVTETAPGQFKFTDPQPTNRQRFYRLFAP